MKLTTADIPVDGQIMRQIISNNFNQVQTEDEKDDGAFAKYQKETNDRLDKLDAEKATHDDVEELRQSLQQRINHLYSGDPRTIKAVVTEVLEENGVI